MRLARTLVAAAAFAATALLVPSLADARAMGGGGGGWGGGGGGGSSSNWHGGGWHGGGWHGGHWHGGCCYYGGYYPFWGGVAIGASIGYWGGYWGGYYPYYPAYYYPAWGAPYAYNYDLPPGTTYPPDNARGSGSGQPVPPASQPAEPIFYPRNGQSPEQTEQDRRDCNRWATTQRGAMADASIFQRATFACMEGRGYTVR
jgi:hypothetical protein